MKNVLVTGGAGFIGSNLCKRLVDMGCNVTSIDNYSTGSVDNHIEGVYYIDSDTSEINKLDLDTNKLTLYHMGEYSRVEQSFNDINTVLDSNSTGTVEVLKFAMKHNAKLIYAGSSTKFGDIGADSSPYAFTKAKNTELVKNCGEWFDLNYAITYFYNVYAKNEIADGAYATLIAKFTKLKKEGKSIYVTSPGTQLRNFTHIDDIVDGLILVGESGKGDGYSIGASESYSILEIAKMFNFSTDQITMIPTARGNRMCAVCDTSKIIELGWSQKHKITTHIQQLGYL